MKALFDLPPWPTLPVEGREEVYPVRRVFCVGRNYAEHAREMGHEPDRAAPFYFLKSAAHVVRAEGTIPYPSGTEDYHHEMELAVLLGAPVGDEPMAAVMGYACALDMTRRDRQQEGKDARRPWDLGKDVEGSAVIGAVTPAAAFGALGDQRIEMTLDGAVRQTATLADLIHPVPDLLRHLGGYYALGPGDVVLTGTPAGVGPVARGQVIEGRVDGCVPIRVTVA